MNVIYPDLQWYSATSERKKLTGRCPYATVHRCPRYYESVSELSDAGITVKLAPDLEDALQKRWEQHELWPATGETATSISGSKPPNCFSNFCPEASFEAFRLFASELIMFRDEYDRAYRERFLALMDTPKERDWRWHWEHIEPLHYSDCPVYSKLHQEKPMSQINFHGPMTGQINVAGRTVEAPVMNLSFGELLTRIEESPASPEEKKEAKSRLAALLGHPVVAAIIGGLAGTLGR